MMLTTIITQMRIICKEWDNSCGIYIYIYIWNTYATNMNCIISHVFHIICAFYSYDFHIFIICWVSGTRFKPQKSYFWHIPGHICFILFSHFCIRLGWGPCPLRKKGTPRLPTMIWRQSANYVTRRREGRTRAPRVCVREAFIRKGMSPFWFT